MTVETKTVHVRAEADGAMVAFVTLAFPGVSLGNMMFSLAKVVLA